MKLICEKELCTDVDCAPQGVPNIAYPWLLKNWDIFIRPLIRRNALIVGFVKKHAHRCMIRYVQYPSVAYAAWSKDEEDYRSSTSGGMASVLTHYFFSQCRYRLWMHCNTGH